MTVQIKTALLSVLISILLQCVTSGITENDALKYLSSYGYLSEQNSSTHAMISKDAMSEAILEFQSFFGLNLTGKLDEKTSKVMQLPRCGVKDKVRTSLHSRFKRQWYPEEGSKWQTKKLTYRIEKYSRQLKRAVIDELVSKAFAAWSAHTDLTFTPKATGKVHIEIIFGAGVHSNIYSDSPFDGPGGVLGHATYPPMGFAHFDDAEPWIIKGTYGVNLLAVLIHEFGHALGLTHSRTATDLMGPAYDNEYPVTKLQRNDILRIQSLYGPKTKSEDSTNTPEKKKHTTNICSDPKVDTMFNSAEGQTYVFKGDYYWELTPKGVADGYPKLISQSWKGLPGDIDAAFTYKNGKTYFFKGSLYWKYVGKKMDGQYPKKISSGFNGIPDNLDAATVWTGNGRIYFFKGTKFWRYDVDQRHRISGKYPKYISNWKGLPNNLDAAITYEDWTYFFKGNHYYRFNDQNFAVDKANPAFPRETANWWFGCGSAKKLTIDNLSSKIEDDDNDDDLDYADLLTNESREVADTGDLYDINDEDEISDSDELGALLKDIF